MCRFQPQKRRANPDCAFDVPLGSARRGIVIIVRIHLVCANIGLETGDRNGFGIFRGGIPEQVKPAGQAVGKGIDILVPGAVEIGDEEHVIVHQLLFGLAKIGPAVLPDHHPAREMNDGKPQQALQTVRQSAGRIEQQRVDKGPAWTHRRHHVHRIGFAGDVGHHAPPSRRIRYAGFRILQAAA